MQSEISKRFDRLARLPDREIGLAEGALIVAAEAKPDIDIDGSLAIVAELAERTQPLVDHVASPSARVEALNHSLFELERFRGNQESYDDPRNSFLDEVLSSRRGLPITLSVLYVEIARRLGLDAHGIGFPGHFLAKIVDVGDAPGGEIIVDPFFARTLTLEDCAERLRAAAGDEVELEKRWLRPATSREIYVRMLNNLKLLYLRQGDGLSALGCFDRVLLLAPDVPHELRDRGLLLERLDCTLAAIDDFERFLELAPHDESAAAIRLRRDALSSRRPVLN